MVTGRLIRGDNTMKFRSGSLRRHSGMTASLIQLRLSQFSPIFNKDSTLLSQREKKNPPVFRRLPWPAQGQSKCSTPLRRNWASSELEPTVSSGSLRSTLFRPGHCTGSLDGNAQSSFPSTTSWEEQQTRKPVDSGNQHRYNSPNDRGRSVSGRPSNQGSKWQ
jgi:hypothetical protein